MVCSMSSSLRCIDGRVSRQTVSVFRSTRPHHHHFPGQDRPKPNDTSEREYAPVTSLLLALQGASVAVLAKLGVHGHGRCVRSPLSLASPGTPSKVLAFGSHLSRASRSLRRSVLPRRFEARLGPRLYPNSLKLQNKTKRRLICKILAGGRRLKMGECVLSGLKSSSLSLSRTKQSTRRKKESVHNKLGQR